MPDTDIENLSQISDLMQGHAPNCVGDEIGCCDNPLQDHEQDSVVRSDGAGEPCPTPLMWQEVREGFLQQSSRHEMTRGPHRLDVRILGEGPPLYFLNNFAAKAELFSLTVWLLRDQFRCVVFDATTDHQRTSRRSKSTMSDFAADLFAVADHCGDEQFPVYGAGFGAAVALQAALDRPQRVSQLILQHGFGRRRLSVFERILASICLSSGQTLDRLPQRRRFQAVNHRPWFPPFDQTRFDFLIDSSGTLPLSDLARRAFAIHAFNVVDRLKSITCPVALLRTEGEGQLAADAQGELERALGRPKIEWMHSAGQHPYLTHPHRVAKIVKNLLSD
jgi:pimeloyl-ACP methyl ester carboxylesterase